MTAHNLTTSQAAYVAGLRELADFLEAEPQLIPHAAEYMCRGCTDLDDLVAHARAAGGRWEKDIDGQSEHFHLTRRFGPHEFALYVKRGEVCERVKVGTTTELRVVDSAPRIPVEVDVYEWRCRESLLAAVQS